ncbi:MAG: hypothetical protein ACR2QF_11250, partial [Geminicoccaceae bacterium]
LTAILDVIAVWGDHGMLDLRRMGLFQTFSPILQKPYILQHGGQAALIDFKLLIAEFPTKHFERLLLQIIDRKG